MPDSARLFVTLPRQKERIELTELGAIIYRDDNGSDVVYFNNFSENPKAFGRDSSVSRMSSCKEGYHASILRKPNGDWIARDGGSLYGTDVCRIPSGLPYHQAGNRNRNAYEINLSNFMKEAGKEPGTIDVKDASLRMFVGAKDLYIDLDLVK